MCDNNCKNKGCGGRGVISKQGIQGVQGPLGPPGRVGDQGAAGSNGADGVSGMTYESYTNLDIDFSWNEVETLIPGAIHSVVDDANYQVHVTSLHGLLAGASGILTLYVNNVAVISLDLTTPTESLGSIQKEMSMVWRGPLLDGQDIEVRTEKSSAIQIATFKVQMLINKEI